MEGELTLSNDATGTEISNVQDVLLDTLDTLGFVEGATDQKTYSSTNYISNGDDRKVCVETLDAQAKTNADNIATNVSDIQAIEDSVGAASGICPLDGSSKVSSTYLPSYVDDVVEYADLASFPVTGETGKIYVALDTNKTYRWSGSAYIEISPSDVNSVNGATGAVVLDTEDISEGSGLTSKYTVKHNLTASSDPTASNDSSEGYSNGSLWVNQSTDTVYSCEDNTASNAVWASVGGGGASGDSGINYVDNSDFETDNSNWTSTDQTNFNMGRTTTLPLRGNGSMSVIKAASDESGEYIYSDTFTIDAIDTASMMTLEFLCDTTATNYADGDIEARIYSVDDSSYLTGSYPIPAKYGQVSWDFQTLDSSNTQYQVHFYCASTNALSYFVKFDEIKFGPQKAKVYGTPSTDEVDLNLTLTNFGNAVVTSAKGWRVGQHLHARGRITIGSTLPTSTLFIALDDYTMVDFVENSSAGIASGYDASTNGAYTGAISQASTTSFQMYGGSGVTAWSSTAPFTWAAGDLIDFEFKVPIQGWSSNVVMSETTQNRDISASAKKSGDQTISYTAGFTNLTSWTKYQDKAGNFDATTGVYTLSEDCSIDAATNILIRYGATAPSDAFIAITSSINGRIAGAQLGDYIANAYTSGSPSLVGYPGTKGETFAVQVSCAGQDITVLASESTFGITKSNTGSQTIAQSESVYVDGAGNAGTSITANVTDIDFTEVNDSHGAWNGTQFTAPMDGRYNIEGCILSSSNQSSYIKLYKNGSFYKTIGGSNDSSTDATAFSGTVIMNNSDYISTRTNNSMTLLNSSQWHHISITRLK